MKKLLIGLLFVLFGVLSAQAQTFGGGAATGVPQVFNITDYGAKCDGSTNDTAAINAAFAAAANSAGYQNSNAIAIVGPQQGAQGCLITSLNGTVFNQGTNGNPRPQVQIANMTLLCHGAGNICMDFTQATYVHMHDISLRGSCTAADIPEIGIQFAVGGNGSTSSAWHELERVNVNFCFGLAPLYNLGSENNTYIDSFFVNNNSTIGPINVLGVVTGGSGYTGSGTYTNVPLTGGSGTGALATVVVAGGAVTTVTVTYQGRDYAAADSLSAANTNLGGAGSGFSIPVTSVTGYAVVLDGENYWRATSPNVSITVTAVSYLSATLVRFVSGNIRTGAVNQTAPLWMANMAHPYLYHTYLLAQTGQRCIDYRDDNVSSDSIPVGNFAMDLDFYCEGTPNTGIFVIGSNATPTITAPVIRAEFITGSAFNVFGSDTNITAATITNGNISIGSEASVIGGTFSSAKIWTVNANITVPSAVAWNAPASFQGRVSYGSQTTPPNIGPMDIIANAAAAYSCARRLGQSYTGPLCNFVRASDSATLDIYPDVNGNLDRQAWTSFCNATTCKLNTVYDQAHSSNATQTTDASRPTFTLSDTHFGNRPSFTFTDAGALALTITQNSNINDLWAAGGLASVVLYVPGGPTQANRILYKSNAATSGWEYRQVSGSLTTLFQQNDVTTSGTWTTTAISAAVQHVVDVQYSDASLANVPTIAADGTSLTLTPVQPVGAISAETNNLLIGNNAATAGTRGCNCSMAEVLLWKMNPSIFQIEAIRRNQAAYYGLGATVN